jgi:hypothetical protein
MVWWRLEYERKGADTVGSRFKLSESVYSVFLDVTYSCVRTFLQRTLNLYCIRATAIADPIGN